LKTLPHRLRDGRCRDCGKSDATSAPDSCTRCALERYSTRGYAVVADPVTRFEVQGVELWRIVAQALRSGRIRSDRFYLYVGFDDGDPLDLPTDGDCNTWVFPGAAGAQAIARALTQRYPQVWVVTTVGCWNAVRPEIRGGS